MDFRLVSDYKPKGDPRGRMHSTESGDFHQSLFMRCKDFWRTQSHALAKSIEGLFPTLVAYQISNVLEQDHPERIGYIRRFGSTVKVPQLVYCCCERFQGLRITLFRVGQAGKLNRKI